MVDKLNIDDTLDPTAGNFREKLNANFTTIKERVGLTFNTPPVVVEIPYNKWEDARFGQTSYKYNVDDPSKTRNEDCRKVAARAFLEKVPVPDPEKSHVTYTDQQFLPYVENTDENIDMLMEIADCGIDLLGCSAVLRDAQSNQTYVNLMLRAVVRKPKENMVLKFNLVLF